MAAAVNTARCRIFSLMGRLPRTGLRRTMRDGRAQPLACQRLPGRFNGL